MNNIHMELLFWIQKCPPKKKKAIPTTKPEPKSYEKDTTTSFRMFILKEFTSLGYSFYQIHLLASATEKTGKLACFTKNILLVIISDISEIPSHLRTCQSCTTGLTKTFTKSLKIHHPHLCKEKHLASATVCRWIASSGSVNLK